MNVKANLYLVLLIGKVKMNDKKLENLSKLKGKDLKKSMDNFQRIMKDIEPFIKKKDVKIVSTAGQWMNSSS